MVKYAHAHPEKKYRSITLKAILPSMKTARLFSRPITLIV